jgi:hypothetical protein
MMLDKFKKLIGVNQKPEAVAPVVAEEDFGLAPVDDAVAEVPAIVGADVKLVVDMSDVQASVAEMAGTFEATVAGLQSQLDAALASVATLTTALEAVVAEKAEMIAAAGITKMTARKEKVVAAIGELKADALMMATGGLDDAAFEAVVSALAGSVEAEAATDMFKEVGASATADVSKVVAGESAEMRLLKAKYPPNPNKLKE